MIFGIEEFSLNDFPGKLSCVLFISGCNFFCPYCHNPQVVLKNKNTGYSLEKVLSFLHSRKKYLDGVVISGGEGTLSEILIDLCIEIKKMEFDIKVDTNGSRPEVLRSLLNNNLVDYIAMDIKTCLTKESYKRLTNEPNVIKNIKRSIELIMQKDIDYEFRTTCVNPFVEQNTIKNISNIIKGAKRYVLQPYNENADKILNEKFFIKINPVISKEHILKYVNIAKKSVKQCFVSYL